jgi:GAF domain-containing protein
MNIITALVAVIIPLVLIVAYAVLINIIRRRRSLKRPETRLFVVYLAVSALFFLLAAHTGLQALWSDFAWRLTAPYALVGMSVVLLGFTRTFLQEDPLQRMGWASAVVVGVVIALLNWLAISLPLFSIQLSVLRLSNETLAWVGAGVAFLVYVAVSGVNAVTEFRYRASPLHRNRITYWFISVGGMLAGLILFYLGSGIFEVTGMVVYWLGAALATYAVVESQLLDITDGILRVLSVTLTALIPAALITGVGLLLVLIFSFAPGMQLAFNRDSLLGVVVAGAAMLLIFLPLSSLTRRFVTWLLFGQEYGAEGVVREYGQTVSQLIDLEALTQEAMKIINRVFETQRGTLLVVEDKRQLEWQLRVLPGLGILSEDRPPLRIPANSSLADWLVRRGDPLTQYTMDVDPAFEALGGDERQVWRDLGMEVFVPIRRSDDLIGLMALGLRSTGRAYGQQDIQLLSTLADQTAVALENASLFDRINRRAEQLEVLNQVGQVITSSLDLSQALELIAGRIEATFEVDAGFIFLRDVATGELVLQNTFGPEVMNQAGLENFRVQIGMGLVGWVALNGRPTLAPDLDADSRYSPLVEGQLAPNGQSAMCVPVVAKGRAIGVILVVDPAKVNLTAMELSLLGSIGSFASIAIENALQVAERMSKLRREVEALRIEIDAIKQEREVQAITETEYFQDLQAKVQHLRQRRHEALDQDETPADETVVGEQAEEEDPPGEEDQA